MDTFPKLPGYSFHDPQINKFHLSQTFTLCNGYRIPKTNYTGIGQRPLDSQSVRFLPKNETHRFDPCLTYGRLQTLPKPKFLPHYALYDKKCLKFRAFFQQITPDSPNETYRIREVDVLYFLEDDTITVIEPRVPNSGLYQGKLIRRGRIPKSSSGDCWHWKDLAIGRDYNFYEKIFHLVDCDLFTREFMASQGLIMGDPEDPPIDSFQKQFTIAPKENVENNHKFKRFPEYEDKVLRFWAQWEADGGNKRNFNIYYFFSDGTISVREIFQRHESGEHAQLLRKMKLPKDEIHPCGEFFSDFERTQFYEPQDFEIGATVCIFNRPMLIYDCDPFTRHFFRDVLNMELGPAIDVRPKVKKWTPDSAQIPPHNGIGSLEDSMQNTRHVMPKPAKKDVLKFIMNANKYLRYEMKMISERDEDKVRRFLLFYSLADSTCRIYEPRIRNSGILGGKYLRSTLLTKPGSNPVNPEYYSPIDFKVGSTIEVFNQKFCITAADLHVYKYMQANPNKFPQETIDNIRNYLVENNILKDENSQDQQIVNCDQIIKEEMARMAVEKEAKDKEEKQVKFDACFDIVNDANAPLVCVPISENEQK